jgi:hypothetical protein
LARASLACSGFELLFGLFFGLFFGLHQSSLARVLHD